MCEGRISKTKYLAFRAPAFDQIEAPVYFQASPGFLPSNSFVSLRELGPADELLIQPLMGSGDWAVCSSNRANKFTAPDLDDLSSPADPYVMGVNQGVPTQSFRIPLEGLDTADLWFWSGPFGVLAAYLVSAVRRPSGCAGRDNDSVSTGSITAEPVGTASGTTQRGCG